MKPAVQYFVLHKNSSGKVCANFQCQDVHEDVGVCALELLCSQALPSFPERENPRSDLKRKGAANTMSFEKRSIIPAGHVHRDGDLRESSAFSCLAAGMSAEQPEQQHLFCFGLAQPFPGAPGVLFLLT